MKAVLLIISFLFFSHHLFALDCTKPMSPQSFEFLNCWSRCKEGVECNRFTRSIQRDSKNSCRPNPLDVEEIKKYFPWLNKNIKSVGGNVYYADLIAGRYGYFMYAKGQELVIHSRVHFSNFNQLSDFHKNRMQELFNQAANIWRRNNPFAYPIEFIFEITENVKAAHIKNIKLKTKTNGPYFKNWNINWSSTTIAHEFGHVLGLDDEYSYFINNALQIHKFDNICEETSIMCKSYGDNTEIKNYHYYMVLRRLFCS